MPWGRGPSGPETWLPPKGTLEHCTFMDQEAKGRKAMFLSVIWSPAASGSLPGSCKTPFGSLLDESASQDFRGLLALPIHMDQKSLPP